MNKYRYIIFYHNDTDGIVGAALWLHNNIGHDRTVEYRLHAVQSQNRVNFDQRVKEARKHKDDRIIVIDFAYSVHANLTIDHHYNPDLGNDLIKNDSLIYNPKLKSCVRAIYDNFQDYKCNTLKNNKGILGKVNGSIEDIVDVCDMVDSAGYPDRKFFFESNHPIMILTHYINVQPLNEVIYGRIVELLWNNCLDVEKVLRILNINPDSVLKKVKKSARDMNKHLVKFEYISVTTVGRPNQFPRYAEFYLNEEIRYTIRTFNVGDGRWQVQCGYNNWCDVDNTFNIGMFAKDQEKKGLAITGGGHFNVGSAIINIQNREKYIDLLMESIRKEVDNGEVRSRP